MNLAEPFIRRPVMTTLVMAAFIIFGVVGFRLMPVNALPNIDFPTINVSAELPGASPETMAATVATPLEKQFSTIAGIDSMISTSGQGTTQITMQFALERDIDAAAQDVNSAIAATVRRLPPAMPAPPSYRKVNPADAPVFFLALTSETLPLSTVNEYAETYLAQRISTINGVAQVQIFGEQRYAVRVQVDPRALASRGVGINEVQAAIAQANANIATGTLNGPDRLFAVQSTGQLFNAAAFDPVIVAYRNGNPVRLREVGRAVDGVQNDKVAAWFKDKRGLILAVQRQPGTNTIELVDNIKNLLPTIRQEVPVGINIDVLYDRSDSIRTSVQEVEETLLIALVLVVLVIFVFLRNLPATIIPACSLPVAIIGTFAFMYMFGYSINMLTLMALVLAVGFIVDDAIVMLENITRHVEMGKTPMQATLEGSREVTFTILSMTLSLAAVFIPVLFMSGILGRLLREFAVTIIIAVLISGLVSQTLTPMLCARMLKPHDPHKRHGRVFMLIESAFNNTKDAYGRSLAWVLDRPRMTMVVFALIVVACGVMFNRMPKGFLPNDDSGQIIVLTEAAQDISFDAMKERQTAVMDVLLKDPHVGGFMSFVGAGLGNAAMNNGRIVVALTPREGRPPADEIVRRLRPKLQNIMGVNVFVQNLPPIRIGGRITRSQYAYSVQGASLAELNEWVPKIEAKLKTVPAISNVTSDLAIARPQVMVSINRERASSLGVSVQQIQAALNSAFSNAQISNIYTSTNQYVVIMELAPEFRSDPSALSQLYIRTNITGTGTAAAAGGAGQAAGGVPGAAGGGAGGVIGAAGTVVPLSAVADMSYSVGPLLVSHVGQLPAVTLAFDMREGASLSDGIAAITAAMAELQVPATLTGTFQGTAQAFQSSLAGMGVLLLLAIIVIYLVLGVLYESFIHPITILSGLPTAALGALATLMIFGRELDMYGFVGIIMLIGLVKKNAIMMIDFAIEAQRNEGRSAHDAIYSACLVRFRPIMMTTFAALVGTLPIAMAIGSSGTARQPLGLAVIGGLLVSQFLTLYLTPVVYIYFEKLQVRLSRGSGKKPSGGAAIHPAPALGGNTSD
jgi:HAE1 family hydrophobic/amphiphilic exporter-1